MNPPEALYSDRPESNEYNDELKADVAKSESMVHTGSCMILSLPKGDILHWPRVTTGSTVAVPGFQLIMSGDCGIKKALRFVFPHHILLICERTCFLDCVVVQSQVL